jgi:DNA-binding MarR family transcriptional regulator
MNAAQSSVRPEPVEGRTATAESAGPCPAGSCTEVAERAWVQLIRAHRSALCSVEKALRAADLPPLEWYDVLLELERGGPLRSRDLQDRLLLAQYNLSRLVDRMEDEGLVERTRCSDDARCQWIRLTEAGAAVRQRMWPVYAEAIRNAVESRLTRAQASQLGDLLGKLSNCPKAG